MNCINMHAKSKRKIELFRLRNLQASSYAHLNLSTNFWREKQANKQNQSDKKMFVIVKSFLYIFWPFKPDFVLFT